MKTYKDLAEELIKLRKEVSFQTKDIKNLLRPKPTFLQKELDIKMKRINEIENILKKADKKMSKWTRPTGNYKGSEDFDINNYSNII